MTDEITNRRKDGTEYQEELSVSPILEDGKPVFFTYRLRGMSRNAKPWIGQSQNLSRWFPINSGRPYPLSIGILKRLSVGERGR